MISYLIEASIGLAAFYGFYRLVLHREKLLSINRYYLLVTSALALIIPIFNFKYPSTTSVAVTQLGPELLTTGEAVFSLEALPFSTFYIAGLILAFLVFGIRFFKATRQLKGTFMYNRNQPNIVEVPGDEAYSFFNTIFIGKNLTCSNEIREQVLAHEKAHIQGLHFLDLLYFEFLKCFFWFNPFIYLYSKSVKLQHEYIADQHVLANTPAEAYEQSLVKLTLAKIDNTLIAAFGHHPIEQRLKMIYKLNSNMMNNLKPLLSLPILAILFVSFSCEEEILSDAESPLIIESISSDEIEIPIQGNITVDELHTDESLETIYEEIPDEKYTEKQEMELQALLKKLKSLEIENRKTAIQATVFESKNYVDERIEHNQKDILKAQYEKLRVELRKIEKQTTN